MAGSYHQRLLLPLGHYLGVSPSGASQRPRHTVMVGGDPLLLTDPELAVWQASRGGRAAARGPGRGRAGLVAHTTRLGLPDAAAVVDRLVGRGLLVELAPYSRQAIEFGHRYRVVPLMLGLGNQGDRPSRYGIGFYAEPVLQVDSLVYRVWQWSHLETSLWAGLAILQERDPVSVLHRFLATLPLLLAFGAAYVDVAGTGR